MHHLLSIILTCCVVVSRCRVVHDASPPSITPAPAVEVGHFQRSPAVSTPMDPISLAEVLLTAVPSSLRQIAATNLPEASAILWSDFLDGKKPSWFTNLPSDIQQYLTSQLGPKTSATATSTSTSDSESTSASTSTSASSLRSTIVTVTSLVTKPAASQSSPAIISTSETNGSGSGLSPTSKLAIGLAIPLAVVLLIALALAVCLVRQRRASRRTYGSVESRPPTPAFLGSTMAAASGNTTTIRGGALPDSLARNNIMRESDPFADPSGMTPPIADVRQKRGSHGSHGSHGSRGSFSTLTPVSEEVRDDDVHSFISPVPVPERSPRRSRDYHGSPSWKDQHQPIVTATPLSPVRHNEHHQGWQSQHPALRPRDSMSFSTPSGPYGRSNESLGSNGIANATTSVPRRKPVPKRTQEPLLAESTAQDDGVSRHNRPWSGGYWKVPKRNYDRYENVTIHEDT